MTMTMANRISDQEHNEGPTPEQVLSLIHI